MKKTKHYKKLVKKTMKSFINGNYIIGDYSFKMRLRFNRMMKHYNVY